jgi:hypothetical protein
MRIAIWQQVLKGEEEVQRCRDTEGVIPMCRVARTSVTSGDQDAVIGKHWIACRIERMASRMHNTIFGYRSPESLGRLDWEKIIKYGEYGAFAKSGGDALICY